ncbi:hypothetical protein PIB30_064400 [Stylosanthes scabra]|uniref:Uncharacterized protein n=1 Tax=Stylosanthes scabra TaxID=79078 RepID=A0ABU6UP69_9FABA|nr:hypothetical protein [Stylosanthes scabra]
MAENLQGDQPTKEVVQIPRELPFIYRWVTNDVLGTPSALDQEYLDELKLTGVLFGGGTWSGDTGWKLPAVGSGCASLTSITQPFLIATSPQSSLRGPVATPSKCMVINSLLRVGDQVLGVASGSGGRYFKIFPVGDHRPFWLSLEGDGRFPSYWSDQAGLRLFRPHISGLMPTSVIRGNGRKRCHLVSPPTRARPSMSGPRSKSRARSPPVAAKIRVVPEGESSSGVGKEVDQLVDISSPLREEELVHASPSPKKRVAEGGLAGTERPRVSEKGPREFSAMDRSFDPSHFIGSHLLGPQASETLRDYDQVESVRWAEWAMLRSATILKPIEPRLTVAGEVGHHNEKLQGDLKVLNLQKVILEEQKAEAVATQLKAEEDLRLAKAALEAFKKEKDEEVGRLKRRELEIISEGERLCGLVAEERVHADLSEVSVSEL